MKIQATQGASGPPPSGPWFDGVPFTSLPPAYYDLTSRLERLTTMMLDIRHNPELERRAVEKQSAMISDLQAIVDATLGKAECPKCARKRIIVQTMHQLRICVRHDLATVQIVGSRLTLPGTGSSL